MYTFLTVLTIIVCLLLILFVLIQNPKGGGLSSAFGGSSQLMGVKKTGDFLEKSTWGLAIALIVLSLSMNFFVNKGTAANEAGESLIQEQIDKAEIPAAPSASPVPMSTPADSTK